MYHDHLSVYIGWLAGLNESPFHCNPPLRLVVFSRLSSSSQVALYSANIAEALSDSEYTVPTAFPLLALPVVLAVEEDLSSTLLS